jgi:hypothetical protein
VDVEASEPPRRPGLTGLPLEVVSGL